MKLDLYMHFGYIICIHILTKEVFPLPNKTIYVAEDDLPLFERAQTLAGGNLSAAIAQAVRRFVEVESARQEGFEEITVSVRQAGGRRLKRFLGQRLARWQHPHSTRGRVETFTVYRTKGGRYAVHRRIGPDWAAWSNPQWWHDPESWQDAAEWWENREAVLEVFDTLEDLANHIPPELLEMVKEAIQEPPLEDLNI